MSYLPPSRLYQRDPEPDAAAPQVKTTAAPRAPKRTPKTTPATPPAPVAPMAVMPTPVSMPVAPMPVTPAPVMIDPAPPVAPTPIVPPQVIVPPAPQPLPPRPVTMGAKEWLVAPAPTLHVEATEPHETVTVAASSAPERKPGHNRNLFHRAQKVVLRHLDRAKTGAKNMQPGAGDPDLLWWAVMVSGSLCMGLMVWGAYSALPRFGNARSHLRAEASPTRLSNDVPVHRIHESHAIRPNPQPPLVHPVVNHPAPPPAPIVVPLPPHEARPDPWHEAPRHDARPAPIEAPLSPLPERKEPVVFVHANPGDSPMIRTWKKIAESSIFLATFTAAASNNLLAQIPTQPQVDYSKQIEALTKVVQTLSDQVAALKLDEKLGSVKTELKSELNDKISKIKANDNSNEFLLLANRLDRLEKMIATMNANPPAAGAPALAGGGNLDEIKSKLGNIEQAILKLQPAEKRISLAPPTSEPPIAAKAGSSHVIFVNLYNQDLWLWINQKQHRAPAGTTLTLDNIPSGPATIEVRSPEGIFHKSSPTLVANETFTLTAR